MALLIFSDIEQQHLTLLLGLFVDSLCLLFLPEFVTHAAHVYARLAKSEVVFIKFIVVSGVCTPRFHGYLIFELGRPWPVLFPVH